MVRLRRFFVSGLSLNPTVRPPEKKKTSLKDTVI